ncbi:MAG: hypothetical protein AAGI63_18315, partial [Planctomycetota bacterium]
ARSTIDRKVASATDRRWQQLRRPLHLPSIDDRRLTCGRLQSNQLAVRPVVPPLAVIDQNELLEQSYEVG